MQQSFTEASPKVGRTNAMPLLDRESGLSALRLVDSPRTVRYLAQLIGLIIALLPFLLILVPWQQTSRGSGKVIGYSPTDRPQTIIAPITGRVTKWYVMEGSQVEVGDKILEMEDLDPNRLANLELIKKASEANRDAAATGFRTIEQQIRLLQEQRDLAILVATAEFNAAEERVKVANQKREAAFARVGPAKARLERTERLFKQGIDSRQDFEFAERDFLVAEAEFEQATADLAVANADRDAKKQSIEEKRRDFDSKIEKERSMLAKAEQELLKAEAELTRAISEADRQRQQTVLADRAGTIFRLDAAIESAGYISAGRPLAQLVPEAGQLAVELLLSGNDIPLISLDQHVRLQFEGWPAVQFAGWPSIAIGTFGGRVALIDATDNGMGQFRILVLPEGLPEWPEEPILRQGARANGWVLLAQVPLGFELWRQLNGFPPAISNDEARQKIEKVKLPKM